MASGCRVGDSTRKPDYLNTEVPKNIPGYYKVEFYEDDFVVLTVYLKEPVQIRGFETKALEVAGEWMSNPKIVEELRQSGSLPIITPLDLLDPVSKGKLSRSQILNGITLIGLPNTSQKQTEGGSSGEDSLNIF